MTDPIRLIWGDPARTECARCGREGLIFDAIGSPGGTLRVSGWRHDWEHGVWYAVNPRCRDRAGCARRVEGSASNVEGRADVD